MTNAILAAELSKAPKKGVMAGPAYWLDISLIKDGRRIHRATVAVGGKVEARRQAKALGATPWNF